jgi:glycosyltransferase involved in cell wall biosynthesis
MTYPLLSICIPSYQRKNDFVRCLESIFSLPIDLLNKIEVCVSDNCSSYDFINLMKSFEGKVKLVFKKNNQNIGFDRNLLEVLTMSTGKYVMLLGNDDVVLLEGFRELLRHLELHSPDAVFSNYQVTFIKSNRIKIISNQPSHQMGLRLDWILRKVGIESTFMSSMTFKRNVLILDNKVIHRFVDKAFIHIVLMFVSLKDSNNIIYLSKPTVNAFDSNEASYNVKKTFLLNLGFIINSFLLEYDKKSINAFKYKVLKHVVFSREEVFIKDLFEYRFINIRSLILLVMSKPIIFNFIIKVHTYIKHYMKFNQ